MALRRERSLLSFASATIQRISRAASKSKFFALATDVHPWYIFCMADFDPMTLGIVDDSAASGGLFDDAIESAPAAEEVEQTAPDGQLEAQTEEPDSAAPPADGVESVDTPPADAPVEPFSFGGREWKSRDEAEHSFKSWEGRIQAEQD